MLAGRTAYAGETVSDTLAAVIRADPDWSSLPGTIPPRTRELLRRCLQKDPKQRLQAIGDARIAVEEILERPSQEALESHVGTAPQPIWRRGLPWFGMAVFGVASLALLALWHPWQSPL